MDGSVIRSMQAPFVLPEIAAGQISLWHGTIVSIPSGWVLCDGSNGTPDLRDDFIVGAGSTYNPGDAAGASPHDHTFTGTGHTHSDPGSPDVGIAGTDYDWFGESQIAGTTNTKANLPTYYSLAYIMKT